MWHSLSSVVDTVNGASQGIAFAFEHALGLTVLVVLAVVAVVTRRSWARACWQATFGQFLCPDPRNLVLCGCFPCGWCIMNVCCPWVCPKFHPPFRLRIILVKARHLHLGALDDKDRGRGQLSLYAEVEADRNPVKTTSAQVYLRNNTVVWNEPVDMVVYPSTTSIRINLYHKDGQSDLWLGSLDVPVDSIYEPPGTLSEFSLCGRSCAKLCSEFCGAAYRWPFVRGAPSNSEWRLQNRQWVDCCVGHKEKQRWAALGDLGRTAMFSSSTVLPGQTSLWSRLSGQKFKAIQQVNAKGMMIRELPDTLRADKDVVMAAVKQDAGALRYAAPALQNDPSVQRAAANVPEPMILQVQRGHEEMGKLWAYFIMHGLDEEEGLPPKMLLDV
mmetsp:Transcript_123721/g.385269  ORF Transcript_123721/g.385269 Transcript_123721/m.385269 type:complete len:386 (+) Transcript_123721:146-1303(+)